MSEQVVRSLGPTNQQLPLDTTRVETSGVLPIHQCDLGARTAQSLAKRQASKPGAQHQHSLLVSGLNWHVVGLCGDIASPFLVDSSSRFSAWIQALRFFLQKCPQVVFAKLGATRPTAAVTIRTEGAFAYLDSPKAATDVAANFILGMKRFAGGRIRFQGAPFPLVKCEWRHRMPGPWLHGRLRSAWGARGS